MEEKKLNEAKEGIINYDELREAINSFIKRFENSENKEFARKMVVKINTLTPEELLKRISI